jgi:O-antigen ligase
MWLGLLIFSAGPLIASIFAVSGGFRYTLFYLPLVLSATFVFGKCSLEWFVRLVKGILLAYAYASLLAAAVVPSWALQDYQVGLIASLPVRLFGITAHPNILGPLMVTYLLLDSREKDAKIGRAINLLVVVAALLLSQSKTAWLGGAAGLATVAAYRLWSRSARQRRRLLVAAAMAGIAVAAAVGPLFSGNPTGSFYADTDGSRILDTIIGRTAVWKITLGTWQASPLFGYGPNLWNLEYRLRQRSLFMWAGQAHNQFIQSLGEAGVIGLLGLLVYCAVLIWHSVKVARLSSGVSLGLIVLLMARTLTEVPLRNYGFDESFLLHYVVFMFLLLAFREQMFRGGSDDDANLGRMHVPQPA